MGTNTLTSRVDGEIIPAADHNELVTALGLDFVPRNASRVPTDIVGSLGTSALRWLRAYAQEYFVGDAANNLRIYEPVPGVMRLENGNNDYLLVTNGTVEMWTNNVRRFRVNDSGIVWSEQPDDTIPRRKLAIKQYGQSARDDHSESDNSDFDLKEDFTFTFLEDRRYMVAVIYSSITVTGIGTGDYRLTANGDVLETFHFPVGSHGGGVMQDWYLHNEAGSTEDVEFSMSVSAGGTSTTIADARLICWEV